MSAVFKTAILALVASAAAVPAYSSGAAPAYTSAAAYMPSSVAAASTLATSYRAAASSAAPVTPPSADDQKKLAELLKTKVTAIDRAKLLFVDPTSGEVLPKDKLAQQLVFDFSQAKPAMGEFGGAKAAATVANFPWLTEQDLSTTVAFLGPCGMNTPHVHPRGNEFLTTVNNTLEFGMILENGLVAADKGTGELTGTLNAFQGTVFPKGAIHYQFNPTCDTTAFVAVLSDVDAGTNQVAQGFFGLNEDVVEATLGFTAPIDGKFIDQLRGKIPLSLAKGVEQCLAKCKISKV
jgi:hypothetical protein